MKYLILFIEFFKTGLFSFGGGYATLPFLFYIGNKYEWYTSGDLMNMLSISSMTPGAVGLNMATYCGFNVSGMSGSIVATISVVLPSLIIVIMVSEIFKRFCDNFYMESILYSIKPAACAMLFAVVLKLLKKVIYNGPNIQYSDILNNINFYALSVFIIFFLISMKLKKNPLFFIFLAIIIGSLKYLTEYYSLM